MRQRIFTLFLRILATLGTLALLVPSAVLADEGQTPPFEATDPAEVEAIRQIRSPAEDLTAAPGVPPLIDVWHGTTQLYGHLGEPQRWFNILGNVSDGDGVSWIKYSLNGAAQITLTMGPDGRRLVSKGDFNVDIDRAKLKPGTNQVDLTARDKAGNESTETVTIQYTPGSVWPLRYTIDWSEAFNIPAVAQVVDGKWQITSTGIHTDEPGYDRLVAIGDITWSDYEVKVPLTVHSIQSSGSPGVGILMRWTGHTDDPVSGKQPKSGWWPLGAIGWYRWFDSGSRSFQIYGNRGRIVASTGKTLKLKTPYYFKMRVETLPGNKGKYSLKMWEANKPEPDAWDLSGQEASDDPQKGCFLLLAHRADVTFGDVQVSFVGTGYSLTTAIQGSGTVERDPDYSYYDDGDVVKLTPTPAPGWSFDGWSGADASDLVDNGDGTWSLDMTKDRSVTAAFSAGCYSLSLNIDPAGTGSVSASPSPNCGQARYLAGTTLQLIAQPIPGYAFSQWTGDLSGHANPGGLTIAGDTTVTAAFVESNAVYEERFEGYGAGADPAGWYDTKASNSMAQDDSLFKVYDVSGNKALGTTSTLGNIHSHYVGAGSRDWSNYRYRGRMRMTSPTAGIGITFYSDYADTDSYYRLRRYDRNSFHLAPHPQGGVTLQGDTDTGEVPQPNVWYWFLVEVENQADRTEIRAKVWPEGTLEPEGWQVDAWQSGGGRFGSGRIGVWGWGSGSKYWDDVVVEPLTPPVPPQTWTLGTSVVGTGRVDLNPAGGTYTEGTRVEVRAVAEVGWRFDHWEEDLLGSSTNPETVTMDGDKVVKAVFVAVPQYTLTTVAVGTGEVRLEPSGGTYSEGSVVSVRAEPGAGWRFDRWEGALTGTANPQDIVMDGDKGVTAYFVQQHSLVVNLEGEGSVDLDPPGGLYDVGTVVSLTPEVGPGWRFDHWEGDQPDGNGRITMDADKTVRAVFVGEEYTLTTQVDGPGKVEVSPSQGPYHYNDLVQFRAIADPGHVFTGWSGDLSGVDNPADMVVGGNAAVTAHFEERTELYAEGFEGHGAGADPAGWYDTKANNSMVQDDSLFKVYDVSGNKALGTTSTLGNIHSHYVGAGSEGWSNYRYRGRMRMTAPKSGLGVTFYSDYADTDSYYRLRRYSSNSFHLAPHPQGSVTLVGDLDTGVIPQPNVWYWFEVEVENQADRTEIRARVWPEGTAPPTGWQAQASHVGTARFTSGRIGVWSWAGGQKYWDDLSVDPF